MVASWRLYFYILKRYLFSARKGEKFLSVIGAFSLIGIILGVATLIIVLSIFNGFHKTLLDKVLRFNSPLTIYSTQGPLENYTAIMQAVQKIPGINEVIPVVESQGVVLHDNTASGVMIRGLPFNNLMQKKFFKIKENTLVSILSQEKNGALIGEKLAQKLGVSIGESVKLILPNLRTIGFSRIPRTKTLELINFFNSGMSEYDRGFLFISLEQAQHLFGHKNTVSFLEVYPHDLQKWSVFKKRIAGVLGENIRIFSWQEANQTFFEAILVERNVMFIVLSLIILIAVFNILTGLVILVKDKQKDIAILRTMGMSKGRIQTIFIMLGGFLGGIGVCIGILLGVSFAIHIDSIRRMLESLLSINLFNAEIYYLAKLPALIDSTDVITVALVAFLMCLLATIYPARRAACLNPVEILRNE